MIEIKEKIQHWETMLFSLYYHDIIYSPQNTDNEEKSAELAESRMKKACVSKDIIDTSINQIIATKTHLITSNEDTNYFTDIDLSILGQNWESYSEYCKNVRKEYAIYPSAVYDTGRKNLLNKFLAMERIFKTNIFFEKFEKQARINIKSELDCLRKENEFYFTDSKQFVFVIEDDGNINEFFYQGVELIDEMEEISKIIYCPGFFDSAYYRFYYKNVKLNLEYSGMLGTNLLTEPNPSENDIIVAREIHEVFINIKNKKHS